VKLHLKGKTYADTFDLESNSVNTVLLRLNTVSRKFYLDSKQFPETISRFSVK
jgi:hypothetical protein